ncbi:hypothetical protein ABW20_dc0109059 [Dactylellina cionopaga]|nr:hypothetical protein ABW20_dc0109059 [Dactylellina cionopaga]
MCWNIKVGRCSHPEPFPDYPMDPSPPRSSQCTCNNYITTYHGAQCNPCIQYLTLCEMAQEDYIDVQLYNRNVTYFLQSTKSFGINCSALPPDIAEWVNLPNHVRFTVDKQGALIEGVGLAPQLPTNSSEDSDEVGDSDNISFSGTETDTLIGSDCSNRAISEQGGNRDEVHTLAVIVEE